MAKGAKKFLAYKRDLLKADRIAEIEARIKDLKAAIATGARERVAEAQKQLNATCQQALPRAQAQGWWQEQVEVLFVAIVIALGLRAYYLQPFRIPTGSMQPSLNGIIGHPIPREQWPSLPVRMAEYVLKGRRYVRVELPEERRLALAHLRTEEGTRFVPLIQDFQWWHFFSRSKMAFQDGKPMILPAPKGPLEDIGLDAALRKAAANQLVLPAGTILAEGAIDSGDLVLVDKFSYHFRRPKRGEVFVFDTLGIRGIQQHSGPQGGGAHYIKRLVGLPGDRLEIQTPDLLINGKIASEPMIRRVAAGGAPFPPSHRGYVPAFPSASLRRYLTREGEILELADSDKPGMREYAAMGDNTGNSLDSRYWGPVKEFNLVGPALLSLWPITSGHWGLIK